MNSALLLGIVFCFFIGVGGALYVMLLGILTYCCWKEGLTLSEAFKRSVKELK